MKLRWIFGWGFVASLAFIGCLFWAFWGYEVAEFWPLNSTTRLSQDKFFEILRNAVTAAAALGVGVTLFFSYRRQQTAEKNQELAVEAQRTAANAQQVAADALKLSTQQHELDQSRRRDALVADLRVRYAKAAEQLAAEQMAIKIAGIYSLSALADDWAEHGDLDQRQVCIDLLCASLRSHQSVENQNDLEELERLTFHAIQDRLKAKTPDRKFWGDCILDMEVRELTPNVQGLVLQESGRFTVHRLEDDHERDTGLRRIELNGGSIELFSYGSRTHSTLITDSWLASGKLLIRPTVRPANGEEKAFAPSTIIFYKVTFGAATVSVEGYNAEVIFHDCVFRKGAKLNIYTTTLPTGGHGSVSFDDCRFETELFRSQHFGPDAKVRTGTLRVDNNCTYSDGVQAIRMGDGNPNADDNHN